INVIARGSRAKQRARSITRFARITRDFSIQAARGTNQRTRRGSGTGPVRTLKPIAFACIATSFPITNRQWRRASGEPSSRGDAVRRHLPILGQNFREHRSRKLVLLLSIPPRAEASGLEHHVDLKLILALVSSSGEQIYSLV